jgi:putative FmdB family regulatory protein
MPIYEYRCSACGHDVEALQKFSDAPLLACPSCHKDALVKRVSAAGFHLKGSGWYATDFKGGTKPAPTKPEGAPATDGGGATEGAAKSGGKDESGSATKGETRSETKSEAKSETKSDAPGTATKSGTTPAAT